MLNYHLTMWEIHVLGKQGRLAMLSTLVSLLLRYLRLRPLFSKTKSLGVIDLSYVKWLQRYLKESCVTQRMDLRTQGVGRVSWNEVRECHGLTYTTKSKRDSQWEAATQHREISLVLCDYLERWDREVRRETQEGGDLGIYVYVYLIHFVIKQKLTHHCKSIILQ